IPPEQANDGGSNLVVEAEYDIFGKVFVGLVEYEPVSLIAPQTTLWAKRTSNDRPKALAANFVGFFDEARSRNHIHTAQCPIFNKFDIYPIPLRSCTLRHSTDSRLLYVSCDVPQCIDGVNCGLRKEFGFGARIT